MSGTVVFQVGSLATPGPGIVVGQDDVGGTAWQYVKLDVGPAGTSRPVSYASGTGMPVSGLGTFQALGSVQGVGTFQVLGTVQTHGTSQVLGSVQGVGTFQVLGSVQPVGTAQVLGTIQSHGTNQALGTYQPLAGSVHLASGTVQVLGSVQGVGTFQVLGSVQTVGTSQVLGTVRTVVSALTGENFFGTLFTGGVTNGTLIPAPAQGTYVRVFDMMVSGSAAGTAFVEFGDGTAFVPGVFAANGGFVFNSARGVRTHGTSHDILFNAASGTWGVSVNYSLET